MEFKELKFLDVVFNNIIQECMFLSTGILEFIISNKIVMEKSYHFC